MAHLARGHPARFQGLNAVSGQDRTTHGLSIKRSAFSGRTRKAGKMPARRSVEAFLLPEGAAAIAQRFNLGNPIDNQPESRRDD